MRTPLFGLQDILSAFQRKKVLTKDQLLEISGCSTMTAWRLLRQQGYFTSYNHNARYYTIEGTPKFDRHGLWRYRDVRFSKWGSLTKTIVRLVKDSPAGLRADELQQLLDVKSVKPALTRLFQTMSLTRETIDGQFVYFPVHVSSRRKQQQLRRKQSQEIKEARVLPPLEYIVALLVEIIRRPNNTPRQWIRRLTQRNIRITTRDIQRVLDHYRIDPKKGLLNS
jgi:hypothetical protein